MSRSISLWDTTAAGSRLSIEAGSSGLLGSQSTSKEFWALPIHARLGVTRLAELGISDPVWFKGWDELAILEQEVAALETHMEEIPFYDELKGRWIENLRHCLELLKKEAPEDSVPELVIG